MIDWVGVKMRGMLIIVNLQLREVRNSSNTKNPRTECCRPVETRDEKGIGLDVGNRKYCREVACLQV